MHLLDVEGTMIKEKTLLKFQKDLQNGMSIADALEKHQLTFKYVCDNLPRAYRTLQRRKTGQPRSKSRQYIKELRGKYYLQKSVEGRMQHFGVYDTITDAVKVREYCKKHGWKWECIDEYCRRCNVKRRKNEYDNCNRTNNS